MRVAGDDEHSIWGQESSWVRPKVAWAASFAFAPAAKQINPIGPIGPIVDEE